MMENKSYNVLVTIIKLIILVSGVLGGPSSIQNNNTRNNPKIDFQGEPQSLISCETSQNYSNLTTFEFSPQNVPVNDSTCLSFRIFEEMGFIQQFHIPSEKLSRFILSAQKGYRSNPYHNWKHGFGALQFTFAVLKKCGYVENDWLTPLEGLALLTASMCHDLDHPGTSSRYQVETNSSIAQAHPGNSSVLERYHIDRTLKLLQNEENNFVAQLPESEHSQFIQLVREIILATDLARHFQVFPRQQEMARDGFNDTSEEHHSLLRSLVITSADLSEQTKDWMTARRSAKLIYTEYFNQGDKEKEMGIVPARILDRCQANVAEEQTNFISKVVHPVFRVLNTMCPEAQECSDREENNLKYWQRAIQYFGEQSTKGRDQLDILNDKDLDEIPNVVGKE